MIPVKAEPNPMSSGAREYGFEKFGIMPAGATWAGREAKLGSSDGGMRIDMASLIPCKSMRRKVEITVNTKLELVEVAQV